ARQVLLQCRMLGCVIPTFDILFSRPRQRFGYFSCVDLTTGQISWYRTGREPESSARETSSSTRKTNFVLDAQTKMVSDVNRLFEGGPMFSKTISQKSGRLLIQACLFAVVAAAVQLFTVIGLAQSTFGQFVGTVKDPSGAVIPGVMVTVKNLGTSAT